MTGSDERTKDETLSNPGQAAGVGKAFFVC